MSIKALIAAAVVVSGMGQAADAATVRYDLRYEDSVLEDAWIYYEDTDDYIYIGETSIHEMPWNLPSLYPELKKGNTVKAYAEFEKHEDEWGDAEIAPVCDIGGFDCSVFGGERFVYSDSFSVVTDAFGVWKNGSQITVTSWGEWYGDGFQLLGDGFHGHAWALTSTFTIIQPAPVPLPASAALLSLGLGALALMRRRQKRV